MKNKDVTCENETHNFGNRFISDSEMEVVMKDGEPMLKVEWTETRKCKNEATRYSRHSMEGMTVECQREEDARDGVKFIELDSL